MSEREHDTLGGRGLDAEITGRLLALAKPPVDAAQEAALLERIVSAAARTPRLAVVTRPSPSTAATRPIARAPTTARVAARRDVWAAVGVLAASLIIGFVTGQTALPQATVFRVAEASGVTLVSQDVAGLLATAEQEDDD